MTVLAVDGVAESTVLSVSVVVWCRLICGYESTGLAVDEMCRIDGLAVDECMSSQRRGRPAGRCGCAESTDWRALLLPDQPRGVGVQNRRTGGRWVSPTALKAGWVVQNRMCRIDGLAVDEFVRMFRIDGLSTG